MKRFTWYLVAVPDVKCNKTENAEGSTCDAPQVNTKRLTKDQWLTLVVTIFVNFGNGLLFALQAPFFPKEAELRGATAVQYGMVFGVFELAVFVSSHAMGKLVGYTGPRMLLIVGPLFQSVSCLSFGALGMVNDKNIFIGLAIGIRILEGLGKASTFMASNCLIAAVLPDYVGTFQAVLLSCFGVGLITGPSMGGFLYDVAGFGVPFYAVGSVLMLVAITSCFVLPQSGIRSESDQKKAEKPADWKKFWFYPGTLMYAFILSTVSWYFGFNQATLENHLRPAGFSSTDVGLAYGIQSFVFLIATPITGWLSDKKCDSKTLCMFGCILMSASLILIVPMPFTGIKTSWGTVAAAMTLFGLTCAFQNSTIFRGVLKLSLNRGFPKSYSTYGLVSSLTGTSVSLGSFIGPTFGGYVVTTMSYEYGILIIFVVEVIVFCCLILFTVFSKLTEGRNESPVTSVSFIRVDP